MAQNENLPAVNINIDEEWKEVSGGDRRESTFNEKNYLNVRLADDENKKSLRIRLLPMDPSGGTPFVHVHFHNVEVNKELVKPGSKPYKSYVCLNPRHNPTIDHATFGDKCPFCEVNKSAYEDSLKATTKAEKDAFQKISLNYKTKEAIIVRCIERGKEDEGVKFWKFNLKYDNTDPYHKILDLAKTRKEEGAAVGQDINILDLYRGRDLTITINRGNTENQTAIDVIESSVETPVTNDPKQLEAWLNDSKKWQDVFTAKPYEYLQLIQEGKVPWFDKALNKWVDKEEYEKTHKQQTDAKNEAVETANRQIKETTASLMTSSTASDQTQVIEDVSGDSADDLPF